MGGGTDPARRINRNISAHTVARKLNRSENAVFLKRQRLGIGGFMANTDMLTRNTLSRILGVENRTLQYWGAKG